MSDIYIKLSTLEYPRHIGDIQLDPDSAYAPVEWVDPPVIDTDLQITYEGKPVEIDGVWHMTWIIEDKT